MGTVSETTVSGSTAAASFTSSGKTGDVQVKLLSGGETVGTATIHIQNPDKLAFTSGEVNLNYSESSDLGFKATYQSETVHLKDGDIDWSISDTSAGSFAGNVFTVTDNVKYSGSPTVTAKRGDLSATVTVNIGMEPTMILDGGDADPWDYSTIGTTVESFTGMASDAVATYHYAGRGGVVKGSVVSDTDEEFADIVRFGHNAIKLEYDWTGLTGTDGACLGLGDNLAIDGTPTALGVWVYIPEGVPVPWAACADRHQHQRRGELDERLRQLQQRQRRKRRGPEDRLAVSGGRSDPVCRRADPRQQRHAVPRDGHDRRHRLVHHRRRQAGSERPQGLYPAR